MISASIAHLANVYLLHSRKPTFESVISDELVVPLRRFLSWPPLSDFPHDTFQYNFLNKNINKTIKIKMSDFGGRKRSSICCSQSTLVSSVAVELVLRIDFDQEKPLAVEALGNFAVMKL